MESLSDELLLESYLAARELNLSKDFLLLMKKEIEKRSLSEKLMMHDQLI